MKVSEFEKELEEVTKYSVHDKMDCEMITSMMEELVDKVNEEGIEED